MMLYTWNRKTIVCCRSNYWIIIPSERGKGQASARFASWWTMDVSYQEYHGEVIGGSSCATNARRCHVLWSPSMIKLRSREHLDARRVIFSPTKDVDHVERRITALRKEMTAVWGQNCSVQSSPMACAWLRGMVNGARSLHKAILDFQVTKSITHGNWGLFHQVEKYLELNWQKGGIFCLHGIGTSFQGTSALWAS